MKIEQDGGPHLHLCLCADERDRCHGCEVARIAHLAVHGWPRSAEDEQPVTIDVGIGDYFPHWPIVDGNHRIAAAAIRGDTHIEVRVAGDYDRAVNLLVLGRDIQA